MGRIVLEEDVRGVRIYLGRPPFSASAKAPNFVIPAEAGTQRLPLVIPAKANISSSPRRPFNLVIPAKAGIQLLAFAFDLL